MHSDEDPPLDRILDRDSLLDNARIRDQSSDLTRSDPDEELNAHIEMGKDRRPTCANNRKAPHWEVPHGRILKFKIGP